MSLFPMTHRSAVRDLASTDPACRERARERIARAYWKPIYKFIRLRWKSDPERAQDLVQGFFEHALDAGVLGGHDPERSRFRTYLRVILERYVIDQHRRENTERKGGKVMRVDFAGAESELPVSGSDPQETFDAEFIRHLMQLALERLDEQMAAANKPLHAVVFREHHLTTPQPTYAEIAAKHDISVSNVTNWLHAAKKQFRQAALETLAEVTLDEDDFASEALAVFGIDVKDGPPRQ